MAKKEYDNKKTEECKLIEKLKQYRNKFEARWYVASAFYDGFHFSWGKRDKDGRWLQTPTPKGKVLRQIPKAKKHLNNMRNMIMKLKLRPVVYPDKEVLYEEMNVQNSDKVKQEEESAAKMGSYVAHELNEEMKLQSYRKKLIKNAELMSHSFIQILTDKDKPRLKVYDAFEISVPIGTMMITDETPVVKHISKKLSDLKKNKAYDKEAIKKLESAVDGKYSDSKFKEAMMNEKYGNADDDLVLLDELYIIEDGKLNIYTYIGEEEIRVQNTNFTKIPISIFVWDDEAYQTSVMEDFIPLNRSYDMFISKLEHKVKKLDTGRILAQKKEKINPITTNDGEIIKWSRVKPEVMQESQVSQAFYSLLGLLEGDMKEQGVAAATGSSLPSGVKAWRAIEALKESDYASIGLQIDNYIECITDLTEKLIDIMASNITTPETVQIPGEDGKSDVFKVIGKQGYEARSLGKVVDKVKGFFGKENNMVVIDPNRKVKVEMDNQAGWTEAGKRDLVIELVGAQILPKETAIQMLQIGNTRDIIKQMEIEMTKGKSIVDMPDFKLLPKELQIAIIEYLRQGGVINDPNAKPEDIEEVKKVANQ